MSNLANILRAEHNGNDLQQDNNENIVVCAEKEDGTLYRLGHVSQALVYQAPDMARAAISRIKFRRNT